MVLFSLTVVAALRGYYVYKDCWEATISDYLLYLTFERELSGLFFFSPYFIASSKKIRHPVGRRRSSSLLNV